MNPPDQTYQTFIQLQTVGEVLLIKIAHLASVLKSDYIVSGEDYDKIREYAVKLFPQYQLTKKPRNIDIFRAKAQDNSETLRGFIDVIKDVLYYRESTINELITYFKSNLTKSFEIAPDFIASILNTLVLLTKIHYFLQQLPTKVVISLYICTLGLLNSDELESQDLQNIIKWQEMGMAIYYINGMITMQDSINVCYLLEDAIQCTDVFEMIYSYHTANSIYDINLQDTFRWEYRCRYLKYIKNIYEWYLLLPLISPKSFMSESIRTHFIALLKSFYVVQIHNNYVLYIHNAFNEIITYYKENKRRDLTNAWGEFGKRAYFTSLEASANQNAYQNRIVPRRFIIKQLEYLEVTLKNQPKLSGQLFPNCIALLHVAQFELSWIIIHTLNRPMVYKGSFSSSISGSHDSKNFSDSTTVNLLVGHIYNVAKLFQNNLSYVQDFYLSELNKVPQMLMVPTRALPNSSPVRKASQTILNFFQSEITYENTTELFQDSFNELVHIKHLVNDDGGDNEDDPVYKKSFDLMNILLNIPDSCAYVSNPYEPLRRAGSLKSLFYFIPLLKNIKPYIHPVSYINIFMDFYENLTAFVPDIQRDILDTSRIVGEEIIQEMANTVSSNILSYIDRFGKISKSIDFVSSLSILSTIKDGKLPNDVKPLICPQSDYDSLVELELQLLGQLYGYQTNCGTNGIVAINTGLYRPSLFLREAVYESLKSTIFSMIGDDKDILITEPYDIDQYIEKAILSLNNLCKYVNIGLNDMLRDFAVEMILDDNILDISTIPSLPMSHPNGGKFVHMIGRNLCNIIRSLKNGKVDSLNSILTLCNLRNMNSMVNLLGVPGIKVLDLHLNNICHEFACNILSTVAKHQILKDISVPNIKMFMKKNNFLSLYYLYISLGVSTYLRFTYRKTLISYNDRKLPLVNSLVTLIHNESNYIENANIKKLIDSVWINTGNGDYNYVTEIQIKFILTLLENSFGSKLNEAQYDEISSFVNNSIIIMLCDKMVIESINNRSESILYLSLSIFFIYRTLFYKPDSISFIQWYTSFINYATTTLLNIQTSEISTSNKCDFDIVSALCTLKDISFQFGYLKLLPESVLFHLIPNYQ